MRKPLIFVIGELSEPVTGAVVVTRAMVSEFQKTDCRMFAIDVAVRSRGIYVLLKALKYLASVFLIPVYSLRYRVTLYMPVNAFSGVHLNVLLLYFVRPFCSRVILHHHVFRYIEVFDERMAWLCSLMPHKVLHLTQCEKMNEGLIKLYGDGLNCLSISNALWVSENGLPQKRKGEGPLVFGHLSNLCEAKGSHEVLDIVRQFRQEGLEARLVMAGPYASEETRKVIEEVLALNPELVDYRGPVYGADKSDFFEDIDIFLFPSRSETEGIVSLEALSWGCPVIAYNVGCLSNRIDPSIGCLVELGEPMVDRSREFVMAIYRDRGRLADIRAMALERLTALRVRARQHLDLIIAAADGDTR